MKNLDSLAKNIEWEDYNNPKFDDTYWFDISWKAQKFSFDFIKAFKSKFCWALLLSSRQFSEAQLEDPELMEIFEHSKRYWKNEIWNSISEKQKLSENFIERHIDLIKWPVISQYQKLSENFIRKHQDKVVWWLISIYQHLSPAFIDEFGYKVNWKKIIEQQKLPEDFIEKHINNSTFWGISTNIFYSQILSENFIKKHQLKITRHQLWHEVFNTQKVSPKFKKEIISKYNLNRKLL